jgi:hypothetical protein
VAWADPIRSRRCNDDTRTALPDRSGSDRPPCAVGESYDRHWRRLQAMHASMTSCHQCIASHRRLSALGRAFTVRPTTVNSTRRSDARRVIRRMRMRSEASATGMPMTPDTHQSMADWRFDVHVTRGTASQRRGKIHGDGNHTNDASQVTERCIVHTKVDVMSRVNFEPALVFG